MKPEPRMPPEPPAAQADPDEVPRLMHRLLSALGALKLRLELIGTGDEADNVAAMRGILAEAEAAWHGIDRRLADSEAEASTAVRPQRDQRRTRVAKR